MQNINIAKNTDTLFITVDPNNFSRDVVEELDDYLWVEYNKRLGIQIANDEEQSEIEALLENLSADDRLIAETHHLKVKGDKYERL